MAMGQTRSVGHLSPTGTKMGIRRGLRALAAFAVVASVLVAAPTVSGAQAGSVVINELHYHPATDPDTTNTIDDLEFLELFNPTAAAVDITGWSFSAGITVTFGPVSIPAGGYVVISPDAALTLATYGVPAVAEYTGKLSNGGETITLVDAIGSEVDSVAYDDAIPWSTTPDGDGPSLELRDPDADNNLAANWGASDPAPTPGALNTALPLTGAISQLTVTPAAPTAADDVVISAAVDGAVAPMLSYKVAFETDVVVPMADDGLSGDGAAGDGVFAATVPAQADGELVRYRIDDGAVSLPSAGDTISYEGYVIADPGLTTNLPDFRWFMDPADYIDMLENHLLDDFMLPTVIAYEGEVYDSVLVRIRGGLNGRLNRPKKSFEFEFPSGHDFVAPALLDYPVDQFAMNANWTDRLFGNTDASWGMFEDAGAAKVHSFAVRLEQNGSFYGLYQFQEKLDGEWRDGAGLDGGAFYKADGSGFLGNWGWEVKVPDGGSIDPVVDVGVVLRQPPSAAKTQYMYDTWDIPNLINYLAVSILIGHPDQRHHNYFVFHDSDHTNRWQMHPWDLDTTWEQLWASDCQGDPLFDLTCVRSPIIDSIHEIPELDAMVWRRARTLLDGPMAPTLIEDNHDAKMALIGTDGALEKAAWNHGNPVSAASLFRSFVAGRRAMFTNEPRVPASQVAAPPIVINELLPAPDAGQGEVLELFNPGTDWVDLSGWTIDGVALTIPGGTVIGPGGYLVFTDDVAAFDAGGLAPETVVVQYPGGLSSGGETVTLATAAGDVIDVVSYDNVDPWPAVGTGYSYELVDPAAANNAAASWISSIVAGGTPGAANDAALRPLLKPLGAGVVEGDNGTVVVDVGIRIPAALTEDVTVSYETVTGVGIGFAEVGVDFEPTAGVLTIPAGDTVGYVPITVYGDTETEPPLLWGEWGLLRFFDASPNVVLDVSFFGLGVFVIVDDDT